MSDVVDIKTAKANGAKKSKARERQATGDWRDGLCYGRQGDIESLVANVITVLVNDPQWIGVLQWDEFAQAITTARPPPWDPTDAPTNIEPGEWSDADTVRAQAWLARHWALQVGRECVYDAVRVIAEKKIINPPRDWLNSLSWDGVRRVDGWLVKYLGASPSTYVGSVGRWMLISAVARIMAPGCKADHVLVLEGPQGIRKSTSLRVLFSDRWFSDTPLDLGSKDRFVGLRNSWCREVAELDAFGRAEIARVKSFVSSQADDFRPPYGKSNVKVPRRCIFVGTVNDSEYLRDPTGNRRFWPVRCGRIDIAALEVDREQLMAEAREMFQSGERWWPEGDEVRHCEEAQADRLSEDAWTPTIAQYVEKQITMFGAETFITVGEILGNAIGVERIRWDQAQQNRVARCLIALGWQKTRQRRGPKSERVHGYLPPSRVAPEPGTELGTGKPQ